VGEDFQCKRVRVKFPPGSTTADFNITVTRNDELFEETEFFTMKLVTMKCMVQLGNPSIAIGRIIEEGMCICRYAKIKCFCHFTLIDL